MGGSLDHRRLRTLQALGVLFVLVLAVAPFILSTYFRVFLTETLIWGLFAMAFDIIYGYTGMLSFGQSTFFGIGAYAVALALLHTEAGLWGALVAALAASVILAGVIGYFAVKVSGHYFVIITVVFSLVFFRLSLQYKPLTGGDDGLSFEVPPLKLGPVTLSLYDPVTNYYVVLTLVLLSVLVCSVVMRSGWGRVFVSIRENERRAQLIGYDVGAYKLLAFVLSGLFAGLAGALYAMTFRYSNASLLHWTVSGQAVLWAIIGGTGTLVGPFLGTGLIVAFTDYVGFWFEHYPIAVGVLIIVTVIFAPRGILGVLLAAAGERRVPSGP